MEGSFVLPVVVEGWKTIEHINVNGSLVRGVLDITLVRSFDIPHVIVGSQLPGPTANITGLLVLPNPSTHGSTSLHRHELLYAPIKLILAGIQRTSWKTEDTRKKKRRARSWFASGSRRSCHSSHIVIKNSVITQQMPCCLVNIDLPTQIQRQALLDIQPRFL